MAVKTEREAPTLSLKYRSKVQIIIIIIIIMSIALQRGNAVSFLNTMNTE